MRGLTSVIEPMAGMAENSFYFFRDGCISPWGVLGFGFISFLIELPGCRRVEQRYVGERIFFNHRRFHTKQCPRIVRYLWNQVLPFNLLAQCNQLRSKGLLIDHAEIRYIKLNKLAF